MVMGPLSLDSFDEHRMRLSLYSLIAAMIGAAFIKLGLAPTTIMTLISMAYEFIIERANALIAGRIG